MADTHPTLVLVRGLPGSGKSYLARAISERVGVERVVLLDPDATDYKSDDYQQMSQQLTDDGVDKKFHPYRFLRQQAHKGIETDKLIIWNQAFTNLDGLQKTVTNLQSYAQDHGTHLPLLVVEVTASHSVARQRIADRVATGGHDVPDEEFRRFVGDYRSFASEDFEVISVDGEANIVESVDLVLEKVKNL